MLSPFALLSSYARRELTRQLPVMWLSFLPAEPFDSVPFLTSLKMSPNAALVGKTA